MLHKMWFDKNVENVMDMPHQYPVSSQVHCVSKKRPTYTTCYNFYIHSSIATIFGTSIAEKVGNQNALYFPTTPN